MTTNGIEIISPTSVSTSSGSASITNDGTVTYTNADFIVLNGVFTSSFKNYMVIIHRRLDTNTGLNFNFTVSGTATTTNYQYARFYVRSTGAYDGSYLNNTPYFDNGSASGFASNARQANLLQIYNPAETAPTRILGWFASPYSFLVGPYGGATSAYQSASTSFDGFRVYSAANHTGRITVYGMVD